MLGRHMLPMTSHRPTPTGRVGAHSRHHASLRVSNSMACRCSVGTARVHVARRPDATIEVSMPLCDPLVLPAALGELFLMLASEGGRRAENNPTLVGFKSSQLLVHSLGTRLNRMVTRRNLVRRVAALRRALDGHTASGGRLVESRRGFGWRIDLGRLEQPRLSRASRTAGRVTSDASAHFDRTEAQS
jgi:hypothetical protein